MRIRRYNDGNVFSALVDKIKAAWAKWKGTLSKLSLGRKIAYVIGTSIKWTSALAQGYNFGILTKALVELKMCKKQLDDIKREAEAEDNLGGVAGSNFASYIIGGQQGALIKSHVLAFFGNLISFGIGAAIQALADNTKKRDSWNYGRKVVDTSAYINYVLRAM